MKTQAPAGYIIATVKRSRRDWCSGNSVDLFGT